MLSKMYSLCTDCDVPNNAFTSTFQVLASFKMITNKEESAFGEGSSKKLFVIVNNDKSNDIMTKLLKGANSCFRYVLNGDLPLLKQAAFVYTLSRQV